MIHIEILKRQLRRVKFKSIWKEVKLLSTTFSTQNFKLNEIKFSDPVQEHADGTFVAVR